MRDYDGLPEHMREGMRDYIEHRYPPGRFLNAVLSNDLRTACEKADHINRHRLFDIVSWLYNEAPGNCWGSAEAVRLWLAPGPVVTTEATA